MSHTNNTLWKLDLLETKFHRFSPRFPHTKKLLAARSSTKTLRKLPVSVEEADREIAALKEENFHKKWHASLVKLRRAVCKRIKGDLARFNKMRTCKDSIVDFISDSDLVENLIVAKLAKIVGAAVLTSGELRKNPPGFLPLVVRQALTDKNYHANSSHLFKKHLQLNKELNDYVSSVWNMKSVKKVLEDIDWTFRLVRGNLTKQERESRKKVTGNLHGSSEVVEDEIDLSDSLSDDDDDDADGVVVDDSTDEDNAKKSHGSDVSDDVSNNESNEESKMDPEEALEKFAIYDNLVGDSDGESDEQVELKSDINYNEVTDQSASEDESSGSDLEFSSFKKFSNLPQLATGYFSGGSDDESDEDRDDVDDDRVVREATTTRKNRRGQRARQKIWAQKYGKEAKHVKKEKERYLSEREQKRLEYEERCRRREEKAKSAEEKSATSSNTVPLGERKQENTTKDQPPIPNPSVHPSWVAKKEQEEKLKNVKFEGKKIKFD